jgi:hypothetical protein
MAGLVKRFADPYRFRPCCSNLIAVAAEHHVARAAANFKWPDVPDMLERWHNRKGTMVSSPDIATLKIEDFAPQCDQVFDMQTAGGVVPLKLVKVDPAGDSGREGGAFSLLFAAPQGPWLPQATYPLQHPALGTMEIFLVPIGPLQGGNGYQAVFA